MLDNIPHMPWFIRPEPTPDGQAVIENGTSEGSRIAVAEWHVAEFIVATVNRDDRIGKWLSAALEDPQVCEEMKADIRHWFGE